jgi:hypothetical protein
VAIGNGATTGCGEIEAGTGANSSGLVKYNSSFVSFFMTAVNFLAPGAVFDAPNEVPACTVGLGHHVTVNTVTFFSGLCVTNRILKIVGLFYNIHCGPHLSLIVRARAAGERGVSYNPARQNNSSICRRVSSWRGEEVTVLALIIVHGYASTKTGRDRN